MKIPAWVKPALWGAVVGAIALAIVGFNWWGWMTTSGAEGMAETYADEAIVAAMTPLCVQRAQAEPDATERMAELAEISSVSQRRRFVTDAGWATLPGASSPDRTLAGVCATQLVELSQTTAEAED